MLRRKGPVVKSVESVLRLEGSLWWERFVKEVDRCLHDISCYWHHQHLIDQNITRGSSSLFLSVNLTPQCLHPPLNLPTPVTSSSSVESPLSSILIHNSLTFTPALKPTFSQILPTIGFRPASGLTPQTITRTQDRIFLTTLVFFVLALFSHFYSPFRVVD